MYNTVRKTRRASSCNLDLPLIPFCAIHGMINVINYSDFTPYFTDRHEIPTVPLYALFKTH